jgi:hypothetical protein
LLAVLTPPIANRIALDTSKLMGLIFFAAWLQR